jgi:hypothetical protein
MTSMLNWFQVFSNAFWILGLAQGLAVISNAYWEMQRTGKKFGKVLSYQSRRFDLNLAAFLFCLGLLLTSGTLWERILWSLLMGWYLLQIINIFLVVRKKKGMQS